MDTALDTVPFFLSFLIGQLYCCFNKPFFCVCVSSFVCLFVSSGGLHKVRTTGTPEI